MSLYALIHTGQIWKEKKNGNNIFSFLFPLLPPCPFTKSLRTNTIIISNHLLEGEKVEAVTDFIFLDSKITADSDCGHEVKRLLWKEGMTNIESILSSKDIILPTKVHVVRVMVFPVVMYRCKSWTIKKAGHQQIDTFKLCWRRLKSPLDNKKLKPVNPKGNQS